MREELAKIYGTRRSFQAVFDKFGVRSGYKTPLTTILVLDVVDMTTKRIVTDHLWFTMGKRFAVLDLKPGDIIRFKARVTSYEKGYRGHREEYETGVGIDYRLSFPTDVVKLNLVAGSNQMQLTTFLQGREMS